jgi:hypothetical protein
MNVQPNILAVISVILPSHSDRYRGACTCWPVQGIAQPLYRAFKRFITRVRS